MGVTQWTTLVKTGFPRCPSEAMLRSPTKCFVDAAGLPGFAAKLPLTALSIGMLVRAAFRGGRTLRGARARLVLLRLKGLAHSLFDVFVVSHSPSVPSNAPLPATATDRSLPVRVW